MTLPDHVRRRVLARGDALERLVLALEGGPRVVGAGVVLGPEVSAARRRLCARVLGVAPVADEEGALCAAPIERVRELAARFDARSAGLLAEPLPPGHRWVLYLGAEEIAVLPLGWR